MSKEGQCVVCGEHVKVDPKFDPPECKNCGGMVTPTINKDSEFELRKSEEN